MKRNEGEYKYKYKWNRDAPDPRDKVFLVRRVGSLPNSVNLRDSCSPVFDQLNLGSCTANAACAALQFLEIIDQIKVYVPLSRLFVYYNSRLLEGNVNADSGATNRNTVKSLTKWGACSEEVCPYNIKRFKNRPSKNAYTNGKKHKITSYFRIRTLEDMKECLAEGYPFIFGFSVFSGFESEEVSKTGVVNLPAAGESYLGGHSVLAVGYNDADMRFTVMNSWGSSWGDKGFFTIPYSYLTDSNLSADFWTVRAGDGL